MTHYLDQQKARGVEACQNNDIKNYFTKLHYLYKNQRYSGIEYILLEDSISKLFVTELDKFYDILFIDAEGDIFLLSKKKMISWEIYMKSDLMELRYMRK